MPLVQKFFYSDNGEWHVAVEDPHEEEDPDHALSGVHHREHDSENPVSAIELTMPDPNGKLNGNADTIKPTAMPLNAADSVADDVALARGSGHSDKSE
jgi:hypothetical protein